MSDAIALVRFPDGDLRAAYYFGSADAVVPLLSSVGDAEALLDGGMETLMERLAEIDPEMEEPADTEDVQIWTSYGAGSWWDGRGSRSAALLVDGFDPLGIQHQMGIPDAPPARHVHDGTPDWVPATWR